MSKRKAKNKPKRRIVWKSATTGRFVSKEFGEANPLTCYKFLLRPPKK